MELNQPKINWQCFHTIIFDFDGVFTNNKVYLDESGKESVRCDRGDGLAFDILRRFQEKNNWDVDYFILSKEKNNVVKKRAEKLKVKCFNDISDKSNFIKNYLFKRFGNFKDKKNGVIYLGNDLNDLSPIMFCGFSFAPNDAHEIIKNEVSMTLSKKGGDGFVREAIEKIIQIDKMRLDQIQEII